MKETVFGTLPDGRTVREFTLENENFSVSLISWAGAIRKCIAYGRDIICGFDTLENCLADGSHQGSLVGRYANRIADGRFTLNGKEYQLEKNDRGGRVHLHGGAHGYSHRLWDVLTAGDDFVTFHMDSPDGDSGYPGHLVVDVTYRLLEDGLMIDYIATTDADTPVNLTNHGYWNLLGCGGGTVYDAKVMINADEYSPIDPVTMIPTGHAKVEGTVFDLRTPTRLGDRISDTFGGYDHNFLLRGTPTEECNGKQYPVAVVVEDGGLRMTVLTDQPCVQFYMANNLRGATPFKGGVKQAIHTAYCFETQTEPDGPNRGEAILHPDEVYRHTSIYRVEKI